MIIGYTLYGEDNGSYFYEETLNQKCLKCMGTIVDVEQPFKVKIKRRFDVSFTYDGKLIVSERFRAFILESNCLGVSFVSLNNKSEFYLFECYNILEFDIEKRGTRFIDKCELCEEYFEIIGATPVFLKNISSPLSGCFYRTDQIFGTGIAKQPVYIVGKDFFQKLKEQHFTGIDMSPIEV